MVGPVFTHVECLQPQFIFVQETTALFNTADFAPLDPTQEVIFPPELVVNNTIKHEHSAKTEREVCQNDH